MPLSKVPKIHTLNGIRTCGTPAWVKDWGSSRTDLMPAVGCPVTMLSWNLIHIRITYTFCLSYLTSPKLLSCYCVILESHSHCDYKHLPSLLPYITCFVILLLCYSGILFTLLLYTSSVFLTFRHPLCCPVAMFSRNPIRIVIKYTFRLSDLTLPVVLSCYCVIQESCSHCDYIHLPSFLPYITCCVILLLCYPGILCTL